MAAALVVAAVLVGCGTGTGTDDQDAGPDCGPAVERADGPDWDGVFADDFDGDALDTERWTLLSSLASGHRNGPECYLGDERPLGADDVSVGTGVLRLTARELDHEIVCPSLTGDFPSRWTGAFATTYAKFSTTYGRVEVRAAFPDVAVAGVHAAPWLWPQVLSYPRAMHTYVLESEPGHVRVAYDGETCLDHVIAPAPPLTGSQPFDQPFTLNLTRALSIGANAFADATPLPASTTVDYVRVWN